MAKISNVTRYPIKENPKHTDYLIGTDSEDSRKTVSFSIESIISSLPDYVDYTFDTKVKVLTSKKVVGKGVNRVAIAINETEGATEVTGTETIIFRVPRTPVFISQQKDINIEPSGGEEYIPENTETGDINTLSYVEQEFVISSQLYYDYYLLLNKGKGFYGVDGDMTVEGNDLFLLKSTEVYSIPYGENGQPIVYSVNSLNNETPIEEVVNNSTKEGGFEITNNADYYFELTVTRLVIGNENPPELRLYRFIGDAGTYGINGIDIAIDTDFLLVEGVGEDTSSVNTFLGLTDVIDNSYQNKIGYVPMVSYQGTVNQDAPNKLKLTKLPSFNDIYRDNTLIRGGVIPLGGLQYQVWASEYVIKGNYYDQAISAVVTLDQGDSESRFDVFILRLNELTQPHTIDIDVIKGTPSNSPLKPSLNSNRELEVSFRLVEANSTEDTQVVSDIIYNENTGSPSEWDNYQTSQGITLNNTLNTFRGNYSLLYDLGLVTTTNPTKVGWTKNTLKEYKSDDSLVFAVKSEGSWNINSKINLRLFNSNNPSVSHYKVLNVSSVNDYGFIHNINTWQVISIPLRDFTNYSASSNKDYDSIEIEFKSLPATDFDWINIQTGIPTTNTERPILKIKSSDDSIEIVEYESQKFDLKVSNTSQGNPTVQEDTNIVKFDKNYVKYAIDNPFTPTIEIDPNTQLPYDVVLELDLTDSVLGNSVQIYHTGQLPFENNPVINYQNKEVYKANEVNLIVFDYKSDQDITAVVINDIPLELPVMEKIPKEISTEAYTLTEEDSDFILHFTNVNGCTLTIPEGLPLNKRYEGKQLNTGGIIFDTVVSESTEIKTVPTQDKNTSEINSVFAIDCLAQDIYLAFGNLTQLGGGSGATTYNELTDKATVDLPTINTPLNNALNGKMDNANIGPVRIFNQDPLTTVTATGTSWNTFLGTQKIQLTVAQVAAGKSYSLRIFGKINTTNTTTAIRKFRAAITAGGSTEYKEAVFETSVNTEAQADISGIFDFGGTTASTLVGFYGSGMLLKADGIAPIGFITSSGSPLDTTNGVTIDFEFQGAFAEDEFVSRKIQVLDINNQVILTV